MDARDFRGIGRPAQEELRRRALFLIEHEGMTQAEAARAVDAAEVSCVHGPDMVARPPDVRYILRRLVSRLAAGSGSLH